MKNVLLLFRPKGDAMKTEGKIESRNEEPKKASIILPLYLWDILEKDSKRCRRSVTKQIEAILVRYYNVEASVDLDEQAIAEAVNVVSQKRIRA